MVIWIKNGKPIGFGGEKGEIRDLWVRDGRFAEPQSSYDQVIDAQGAYIMPGLIDIHTHGSMGVNYSKDSDFSAALQFSAQNGVTTVIPTIGVRPMDELLTAIQTVTAQMGLHQGATIGGVHLEGPFVNEKKKGAMSAPEIPCIPENFEEMLKAGCVRVMTIAPERENALEVIRLGRERGIRMSIGHTDADYETVMAAIRAGATGATHTFNAMRSYDHREPGVLGAVLTDHRVSCEVICDEVHLHPATIELIRRCKGTDQMILVSDSGMITGLGDGEFWVDGKIRMVQDKVARNQNGNLAGSCYTMADSARKLLNRGYTLRDIARIGAENPAKAVGLEKDFGSLSVGKFADFILCDEHFEIQEVYVKGEKVTH